MAAANELVEVPEMRLGRLPMKSTRKALLFSDFFKFIDIPKRTTHWTRKAPLPLRTFGNTEVGDCTRAKQAVAAMRMERLEQRRLIDITDEEVKRVYREMCIRRYGSDADNGAYEDDALNDWRNPDTTFKDTAGHPYTIDAYLRINAANHDEVRAALAFAGARGIAVCLNLPLAFKDRLSPLRWDVSDTQRLIGEWMPGSWGGHSMWQHDYDPQDVTTDHTWNKAPQKVSWSAMAAYCDEAHLVIDSIDTWRKQAVTRKIRSALGDVADAVNAISSIPIVL